MIIAYEPLWTIGRADFQAMKPSDVHQTAIFIRKVINDAFGSAAARTLTVLYGGSVTADNAESLIEEGGVDGLLVGRQSLDPESFTVLLKNIDRKHAGK